ncbi:MAG: outer membrane protein transport protein [Deltaproteobacteria bacterium]|nr:outer membrane protein transport protein [Deltaproteobacteria bacterium]
MKKILFYVVIVVGLLSMISPTAFATNGDNLIGVGPISRAMGVVDGTDCTPTGTSTVDFTGMGMGKASAESSMKPFIVPAVAVTSPLTQRRRFGIGAYGVSGMGVDYKDSEPLYRDPATGQDLYTKLEIMKFAPNLAYLVTPDFSIGASLSIDYGNADFGGGGAHNYTMGLQVGALYHMDIFNFGVSYITPQKITHERVANFDAQLASTTMDDLELESPHTIIFGVSVQPSPKLLAEVDARWYNWADAEGYKDFDWDNQWVLAAGVQYRPIPVLALRAGFNYGKNPVNEHDGFDPMGATNVQGVDVPTLNYEMLRIIGFPAIVEKHLTLGLGYDITERLILNVSYMHAFEETIREASAGNLAILESSLKEDSYSFGLTWRF